MSRFRGAIFDLDGTLLDSLGVWTEVDRVFLERHGFDMPPDYQARVAVLCPQDAALYTIQEFGLDQTPEEIIGEWFELASDAYRHDIPTKPFALDYLHFLRGQGFRIAAATASEREFFESALARTGIGELLDAVVTVSEVGRDKHFPDVYLEAARRIGLAPEECMVFEDMVDAVRSSRSGGFYAVGVYDPVNEADRKLISVEADRFILSFHELLDEGFC